MGQGIGSRGWPHKCSVQDGRVRTTAWARSVRQVNVPATRPCSLKDFGIIDSHCGIHWQGTPLPLHVRQGRDGLGKAPQ